jgi:hypothetical protein
LKRKSVKIRYVKSEEEVRILVKGKTGMRCSLSLVATTGGTAVVRLAGKLKPIDQTPIECVKRSKEKAVKVNRLGSPSRDSV